MVYEFPSFICLANSYKRGGRCIAGIEIDSENNIVLNKDGNPKWIRPIANTQYGQIPNNDANNIKLLSSVGLSLVEEKHQDVHCENVMYNTIEHSIFVFPSNANFLDKLTDKTHEFIFGNRGKAVPVDTASKLDYSLMFIHVHNSRAYIDEEREKSKNRMIFTYKGQEYDLPITDPVFIEEFKKNPECFALIPDVYLTLSLGLEFEGWHHKLVAGVIIPANSQRPTEIKDIPHVDQQKDIYGGTYAKRSIKDEVSLDKLYNKDYTSHNEIPLTKFPQQKKPNWFVEYERDLVFLLEEKTKIEKLISDLRQKILKQMENDGINRINSSLFSISYAPAKTIMQFDSRAFREAYNELYSTFCKPKQREASIVVKRNNTE